MTAWIDSNLAHSMYTKLLGDPLTRLPIGKLVFITSTPNKKPNSIDGASRLAEEFKNYYYLNIKESKKHSDYQARIELIGRKSRKRQDDIVSEDYNDTEDNDIAKFNSEIYCEKNGSFSRAYFRVITKLQFSTRWS